MMTGRMKLWILLIGSLGLITGCSRSTTPEKSSEEAATPAPAAPAATPATETKIPETYQVQVSTSKGPFTIEVHRDWAPIGAARFYELVQSGYYDGARFFRVVPNFVVQFGLAADPKVTKKWDKAIDDDPVKRTNALGTVAFATAGPNTRTTQVFINMRSNQTLDNQGFAPFGRVTDGMKVVESLHSGYGERPDQDAITNQGNAYLTKNFPNLDYIRSAKIL
jgi:peptidyl-prolyl cis-trans isomerase A (cyclophilin A)